MTFLTVEVAGDGRATLAAEHLEAELVRMVPPRSHVSGDRVYPVWSVADLRCPPHPVRGVNVLRPIEDQLAFLAELAVAELADAPAAAVRAKGGAR